MSCSLYSTFCVILGIDEELIKRFATILKVINSGYPIKSTEFERYCLETAERYIHLYDWYYMPTSVHKILMHGANVIQNAILPIGELSEEAQEAKNKDIRRFRQYHTRKFSKLKTNDDLFKRLLLSSDPYLSSFHSTKELRKKDMERDVLDLLQISEEMEDEEDEEKQEEVEDNEDFLSDDSDSE